MEEHRKSIKQHLDDNKARLIEVQGKIKVAHEKYKSLVSHDLTSLNHKVFRDCFEMFPEEERLLKESIRRMEIELLDKKYANKILFSDVEPFEVIEEKTPNLYVVRSMKAVQTDSSKENLSNSFVRGGFVGTYDNDLQEWDITPDENGEILNIRKHKNGKFYDSNRVEYVISNKPCKFYDFNF